MLRFACIRNARRSKLARTYTYMLVCTSIITSNQVGGLALMVFSNVYFKGMTELPDYNKITFPEMPPIPLEKLVPDATSEVSTLHSTKLERKL